MVVQLSHPALLCCIKKMPHKKEFKVLAVADRGSGSPWLALFCGGGRCEACACVLACGGAVRRVDQGFLMG